MTDNPDNPPAFSHDNPEQGGGSGHKDDAKATLQRVCGNLRNDGYLVPISVLTRAIEFLRPSEFGEYCSTPEPQGFDEWVKAFLPRPIGISDPIWNDHVQTLKSAFNAGQASKPKPKAKPFEWEKDSDDGWTAQSPIGEFNVYYCSDYGWLCAIDGCDDVWVKYPSGDDGFATPEFAKGECKRHVQALYDSMGVK